MKLFKERKKLNMQMERHIVLQDLTQTAQDRSILVLKNDTSNTQSGKVNCYKGLKSSWPQPSPQQHLMPKDSIRNGLKERKSSQDITAAQGCC